MIKKKGRKPNSYYENLKNNLDISLNQTLNSNKEIDEEINQEKVPKKRGRKPKGGKIIEVKNKLENIVSIPNVILHLNCSIKDLKSQNSIEYNPELNDIENFDLDKLSNKLDYNFIEDKDNNSEDLNNINKRDLHYINIVETTSNKNIEDNENNKIIEEKKISSKSLSKKIQELTYNFKHNKLNPKSACFWCTCSFDNEPIFIPKHKINETIYCYGHFCSPECAASYLMNENIDSSNKFERYYLLNKIYSKIYDYKKKIKLAPNPYYTLDKFYGNLSIEEYRQFLQNERLLIVVNKPVSKLLPELYEENDDYIINSKVVSSKSNLKLNTKI